MTHSINHSLIQSRINIREQEQELPMLMEENQKLDGFLDLAAAKEHQAKQRVILCVCFFLRVPYVTLFPKKKWDFYHFLLFFFFHSMFSHFV